MREQPHDALRASPRRPRRAVSSSVERHARRLRRRAPDSRSAARRRARTSASRGRSPKSHVPQSLALERRSRRRERELRRLAELRAQRGEVAARRELAARRRRRRATLIADAPAARHRVEQRRRAALRRAAARGKRAARRAATPPARGAAVEKRGHDFGQRDQRDCATPSAAPSDSAATFSRTMPGTSHVRRASSSWLSSASGTVSVRPSSGWPGSKRYLSGSVVPADRERLREQLFGDLARGVAHQVLARQEQQRADRCASASARQRSNVASEWTSRGNALGVERGDRLVVDQHVLPARLVLELGDFGDERAGCARGTAPRVLERAGDERLADEDLARRRGIDRAERHRRRATSVRP